MKKSIKNKLLSFLTLTSFSSIIFLASCTNKVETKTTNQVNPPSFKAKTDSSTSQDPTKPTQEPSKVSVSSENDLYKKDDNYVKLGFWNILNYDDDVNSNKDSFAKTYKAQMLAKTISFNNADVVGLVEVNAGSNKENGVDSIVKDLNNLDKEAKWTSIVSDSVYGEGNESQKERVAFIFKSSLFDILEINKEKLYGSNPYLLVYDNPVFDSVPAYFAKSKVSKGKATFDDKLTTKNVDFARPPVAAKFKLKNTEEEFVVVASHFDSPGVNNNPTAKGKEEGEVDNTKFDSRNGSQELSEANHMLEAMNWFENKTNTQNQFFMADTNIKEKSNDNAFEHLLTQYKLLISKTNKTTLGENFDTYSSSYDKIFFKKEGKLTVDKVYKYPLYDLIKDKLTSENELSQVLENKKNKSNSSKDIKARIRDFISDHSPVFVSIKKALKNKQN
ncbi:endonuclease/exonuclease/phosphatase family protein [Mesomycoplasma hyorhinis]|uniref:endonuclease/exonuclease/phosphatase family protein n=1 Tax=Mesomycoplasma hyorhinis TaxID=2100 RepID=UPI001C03CC6F|nr:endonuclease/exonuclease/phosphatase family protein [Mesomycoplasma hyorhinis]